MMLPEFEKHPAFLESGYYRLTLPVCVQVSKDEYNAIREALAALERQLAYAIGAQVKAEQQRDDLLKAAKDYLEYDEFAYIEARYNQALDALLEAIAKAGGEA